MFFTGFRQKLWIKAFVLFATGLCLVVAVCSFFGARHYRKELGARFEREGRTLARLLAASAVNPMVTQDYSALWGVLQRFTDNSEALKISILNNNRKVLATLDGVGSRAGEGDRNLFSEAIVQRRVKPESDDSSSDSGEKVVEESVIGYAEVVMDATSLKEGTALLLKGGGIMAGVFLVLGGVACYFMMKRVTVQLEGLTDAVVSVGTADALDRVSIESNDEIGRLAEAFNMMIGSLAKRAREHQQLEGKLRYAQKMEAVGTLARGISHDFNNLLSTIRGAVHILQKKLGEDPILLRYTEKIEKSIQAASKLIEGLITFSRAKVLHTDILDINKLIEKMNPLIHNIIDEFNIEVRFLLSQELLMIRGDAFCMEQVVWNLCLNARDAMFEGGRLTVSTGIEHAGVGKGLEDQPSVPSQYATISVSDTGPGIEEKTEARIFEPFFTTKETGKGTGLGLSVVHGIVEQHGGKIELKTKTGEGSTFTIFLPLSD